MHRFRSETGATTAEYAGMLALVALLVAAVTLLGLNTQIGTSIRVAICQILGGQDCGGQQDAAQPLQPCTLASRTRDVGAEVKVAFVEAGRTIGYAKSQRSDGTWEVTWSDSASAGVTAGAGAKGQLNLPSGEFGAGAYASGSLAVTGRTGDTYAFDSEGAADDFISHERNRAILEEVGNSSPMIPSFLNPLPTVYDWATGNDPPEPTSTFVELGAEGEGEAGVGAGPAYAGGGGGLAAAFGAEIHHDSGETTFYYDASAGAFVEAGIALYADGKAEGELGSVMKLTVDRDGNPTSLEVASSVTHGATVQALPTDIAVNGGETAMEAADAALEYGLSASVEGGETQTTTRTVTLDLRGDENAANRDAVSGVLASIDPRQGIPNPARTATSLSGLHDRLGQDGEYTVVREDGRHTALGASGEVALGPKLGGGVTYESSQSDLVDAQYLDRGAPGGPALAPWTNCSG